MTAHEQSPQGQRANAANAGERMFSAEEQKDIVNRAIHINEYGITERDLIASFEGAGLRREAIVQAIAEHRQQAKPRKRRSPLVWMITVFPLAVGLGFVCLVGLESARTYVASESVPMQVAPPAIGKTMRVEAEASGIFAGLTAQALA